MCLKLKPMRCSARSKNSCRSATPLQAPVRRAVAALARTRHAIEDIGVQLDEILDHVQTGKVLRSSAPDRLRASANEARAAMASLNDFSDLYG